MEVDEEMTIHTTKHKQEVGEKIADMLYRVLLLINKLKINLPEVFEKKIQKNEAKYPILRWRTAIASLTF